MGHRIKDISIKNHTYYFLININLKNFDTDNIKIEENSDILIYFIDYLKYVKINNVNPLYLIANNVNGCFEKINKSKYLTLVPTNESKGNIKKSEKLWSN